LAPTEANRGQTLIELGEKAKGMEWRICALHEPSPKRKPSGLVRPICNTNCHGWNIT
jgi:hypothetical protein